MREGRALSLYSVSARNTRRSWRKRWRARALRKLRTCVRERVGCAVRDGVKAVWNARMRTRWDSAVTPTTFSRGFFPASLEPEREMNKYKLHYKKDALRKNK